MSEKNDLTTAIAEDFSGELEPIESAPMVESEEAAQTALYRLVVRDKKIDKIEKRRDFIVSQAKEWAKKEIEKLENQKQYLAIPLESFMEAINKSNPKIKSLKFPAGVIGLRKSPERIEIDADFVPEKHLDDPFIKQTISYSVDKKAIKEKLKETGELPEYASVVPSEAKFYYKGNDNG